MDDWGSNRNGERDDNDTEYREKGPPHHVDILLGAGLVKSCRLFRGRSAHARRMGGLVPFGTHEERVRPHRRVHARVALSMRASLLHVVRCHVPETTLYVTGRPTRQPSG